MLTRISLRLLVAALVAATGLSACGGGGGAAFDRPVLLVSGRDDHGLLAQGFVSLLDQPDGTPVGAVADGGLVEVLEERAEWLRVRTLDSDEPFQGWINDHFLRGQVHLVDDQHPACPLPLAGQPGGDAFAELRPSEQVVVLDHHAVDGVVWVGVRTLQDPRIGLVPRSWVQELPVAVPPSDLPCDAIHVDQDVAPHEH